MSCPTLNLLSVKLTDVILPVPGDWRSLGGRSGTEVKQQTLVSVQALWNRTKMVIIPHSEWNRISKNMFSTKSCCFPKYQIVWLPLTSHPLVSSQYSALASIKSVDRMVKIFYLFTEYFILWPILVSIYILFLSSHTSKLTSGEI